MEALTKGHALTLKPDTSTLKPQPLCAGSLFRIPFQSGKKSTGPSLVHDSPIPGASWEQLGSPVAFGFL